MAKREPLRVPTFRTQAEVEAEEDAKYERDPEGFITHSIATRSLSLGLVLTQLETAERDAADIETNIATIDQKMVSVAADQLSEEAFAKAIAGKAKLRANARSVVQEWLDRLSRNSDFGRLRAYCNREYGQEPNTASLRRIIGQLSIRRTYDEASRLTLWEALRELDGGRSGAAPTPASEIKTETGSATKRETTGRSNTEAELTPCKQDIIALIKKEERSLKRGEILEHLGSRSGQHGDSTIRKALPELISDGLLVKSGSTRGRGGEGYGLPKQREREQ